MEEKRYNNMQTMTKDLYELRLTHDDFIEYAKGKAAEDFKDKTKEDLKNEFIKSIEYLKDNVRNKFTGKESLLSQAVYKSFPDESAKEILSNFAKNCRSYFKVYTKLKKVYLDEKRKDKTTELEKAHLEQKQKEKLDGINVKIIKIVNSMQEEKSDEVRNLVKECYTSFCGVLETERNNIKNDKNLKSPLSRILSDGKDATLSVGEKTIFEIAIFCGWDIKTANDMLGIIKHIGFHSKNVEHCLVHNCLMQMAKGIERTNALKKYLFYKYFYLIMFEEQSKVSTTKGETEADIKDTFFFDSKNEYVEGITDDVEFIKYMIDNEPYWTKFRESASMVIKAHITKYNKETSLVKKRLGKRKFMPDLYETTGISRLNDQQYIVESFVKGSFADHCQNMCIKPQKIVDNLIGHCRSNQTRNIDRATFIAVIILFALRDLSYTQKKKYLKAESLIEFINSRLSVAQTYPLEEYISSDEVSIYAYLWCITMECLSKKYSYDELLRFSSDTSILY